MGLLQWKQSHTSINISSVRPCEEDNGGNALASSPSLLKDRESVTTMSGWKDLQQKMGSFPLSSLQRCPSGDCPMDSMEIADFLRSSQLIGIGNSSWQHVGHDTVFPCYVGDSEGDVLKFHPQQEILHCLAEWRWMSLFIQRLKYLSCLKFRMA